MWAGIGKEVAGEGTTQKALGSVNCRGLQGSLGTVQTGGGSLGTDETMGIETYSGIHSPPGK